MTYVLGLSYIDQCQIFLGYFSVHTVYLYYGTQLLCVYDGVKQCEWTYPKARARLRPASILFLRTAGRKWLTDRNCSATRSIIYSLWIPSTRFKPGTEDMYRYTLSTIRHWLVSSKPQSLWPSQRVLNVLKIGDVCYPTLLIEIGGHLATPSFVRTEMANAQ
ncbi:hypothetical protein F4860DRAFT_209990 [Xylaria cubensis]|nr:hypothetical protein F4860DRAFT_209990 [Xylaria cubensis]